MIPLGLRVRDARSFEHACHVLRAQMLLIETHVREQEEAADLAEAKVVEYDAERTKLLHEAEADARGERAPPGPRGDMAPITEEDAGC